MEGFITIGIILSIIWILWNSMAENADDVLKQTTWCRFKRNFRSGRIYHLFAARTKERLTGELFIYYLLIGIGLLVPIGTFTEEVRPVLDLSDFNRVVGHLAQVNQARSICKSSIAILEQEADPYTTCLDGDKANRLRKIIGQPVVVWVEKERTFFGLPTTWVKQLQHGSDLIVNYADIRVANENSHHKSWLFFGMIPFLFSLASLLTVARINMKRYGPWLPPPTK